MGAKIMRKIIVNRFAERQTADSRFSHFEGTHEELLGRVTKCFTMMRPGYRQGVVLVPVSPVGFFSGVVTLSDGDRLTGVYESRKVGEDPRKFVVTSAEKQPAQAAEIVLYSSEVLAEDGDNELPPEPGNWEVISINASPSADKEIPIAPHVLMHNHFGSSGGTATNLSDTEFVALLREGFEYWKDKAMCGGEE
jgi:hypothetical protein